MQCLSSKEQCGFCAVLPPLSQCHIEAVPIVGQGHTDEEQDGQQDSAGGPGQDVDGTSRSGRIDVGATKIILRNDEWGPYGCVRTAEPPYLRRASSFGRRHRPSSLITISMVLPEKISCPSTSNTGTIETVRSPSRVAWNT